MNVKGVIVEQIDWDGTSKSLTMQHDFQKGDMWVAFPTDYDEPRTGPFYFQNPHYEKEFNSNVAECRARKIPRDNFYEENGIYTYKTLWHNLPTPTGGLTYYALYLPEYAVLTKLNLYDPKNPQNQFERTVFHDEQKPRYIVYLQCFSEYGVFSFNLECQFQRDQAGFASSHYSDEYHSNFYDSPDAWRHHVNVKENDVAKIQNFFSDQVVISQGNFSQTYKPAQMINTPKNNPWISGSFYLVVAIIVMTGLAVISNNVHWTLLPIIIIGGILLIGVVGALQLRNDDKLKEESFLKLMSETYKRLPLLKQNRVK